MNDSQYIQSAAVVTDEFIIAVLATSGVECMQISLHQGSVMAIYEEAEELWDTIKQFESHQLKVDALDCWEALEELRWKMADEHHTQTYSQ